jgi:RNA-directed DNA polymerase
MAASGVGGVHSSEEAANPRGAKGPYWKQVCVREGESRLEKPTTNKAACWENKLPLTLSSLRRKLGQKAEQEPRFRFYTLYGHISRNDTLEAVWARVPANKGAPGVDRVTLEAIEGGAEAFLAEIQQAIRIRGYKPQPARRIWIPKRSGNMRPLGIPIAPYPVIPSK